MKRLIIAAAVATVGFAWADAPAKTEQTPAGAESQTELEEKDDDPLFWGFGNYGIYSGYQLYGNLVNSEPTMQGYFEGNLNIPFDLGYLGAGLWNNSDLTGKRHASYRRAFNEFDYNIHYGKYFSFTDDGSWGLDFRTQMVWYWYPHSKRRPYTNTTFGWNFYFTLKNPYVCPFFNVVHEYVNKGTLLEFGLKRDCVFFDDVPLTITPSITFTSRDENYNWCYPTRGFTEFPKGYGIATMKIGIDAVYMFTDNFGVFAKVAYCSLIDDELRDIADRSSGADYSKYKDFAWGGVGLCLAF